MPILLLILGIAGFWSGEEPAALPSVSLPPELARVLTDYEKAWRSRDAAALAALFAEDGFVLGSGAPPVRGRAAIERAYAGAGGPLVLRALAYATEGDVGYIVGGFSRRRGEADVGKFTLTLRKDSGGRWLIVSDMDNSNSRPRGERPKPALEILDHLVYAAPDLEAAAGELEKRLGVRATAGGQHPGGGTRNALVGLGPGRYLEILAPDPTQPPPEGGRAFGIDILRSPRLARWAAKGTDLDRLAAAASENGIALGAVRPGSRRRPDGVTLSWRFTDPGALVADGLAPFFIDWGGSPHPSASLPGAVSLVELRAEHPDPDGARETLRRLGVELVVVKGPKAALIAILQTPRGRVELR